MFATVPNPEEPAVMAQENLQMLEIVRLGKTPPADLRGKILIAVKGADFADKTEVAVIELTDWAASNGIDRQDALDVFDNVGGDKQNKVIGKVALIGPAPINKDISYFLWPPEVDNR